MTTIRLMGKASRLFAMITITAFLLYCGWGIVTSVHQIFVDKSNGIGW